MSDAIMVKNSIFKNFAKTGNGGVFEISSKKIEIICCDFGECSVTQSGGCLYGSDCNVTIVNSFFHECFTSAGKDNICGNAVYISSKEARICEVSTFLCGTESYKSDSSIRIDYSKTIVSKMNSTKNYGVGGASAIAIHHCLSGTCVKYVNACDGHDYDAIESHAKSYVVSNSNFINCEHHTWICWINAANMISFDSCVFWNVPSNKNAIATQSYTATNCISNVALSGVTVSEYSINNIKVKKTCKIRVVTKFSRCRNNSRNYLMLVILVLST